MEFIPHTQNELINLNIKENETYTIKYINHDYFNAQETIELGHAKAVIADEGFIFVVTDPYGMDKFIKEARVIQ